MSISTAKKSSFLNDSLSEDILDYFSQIISVLRADSVQLSEKLDDQSVVEKTFEVLTSRRFCYLSKKRVKPYREAIIQYIEKQVRLSQPIHFYLDIGGGYHASLFPGKEGLRFSPSLGEFFILYQIKQFSNSIQRFYAPGIKFTLVVDNMCALLINDISVESTAAYHKTLQLMIASFGMDTQVDIFLESLNFKLEDYLNIINREKLESIEITEKEVANIARFLGRQCDLEEAEMRAKKYKTVCGVSEKFINRMINGIHMTQRATDSTICFRAFPGADSRIQCGEVAISTKSSGKLHPILLTSSNVNQYLCETYSLKGLLPDVCSEVIVADCIETYPS